MCECAQWASRATTHNPGTCLYAQTLLKLQALRALDLRRLPALGGIVIEQRHEFESGGEVWGCGVVLGALATMRPDWFRDKNVLELGSGTGAASIAIGLFSGARDVTATDHKSLLDLLQSNVRRNQAQELVQVVELDWKLPLGIAVEEKLQNLDVLVMADVVYFESLHDAMLETLDRIVSSVPEEKRKNLELILVHRVRDAESETRFFKRLSERFALIEEQVDDFKFDGELELDALHPGIIVQKGRSVSFTS